MRLLRALAAALAGGSIAFLVLTVIKRSAGALLPFILLGVLSVIVFALYKVLSVHNEPRKSDSHIKKEKPQDFSVTCTRCGQQYNYQERCCPFCSTSRPDEHKNDKE